MNDNCQFDRECINENVPGYRFKTTESVAYVRAFSLDFGRSEEHWVRFGLLYDSFLSQIRKCETHLSEG